MADDETLKRFVFDSLAELKVPVRPMGEGRFVLDVPPKHQPALECDQELPLTFSKEIFQKADESNLEYVTPGSPVLNWVIEEIRSLGSVFRADVRVGEGSNRAFLDKIASSYRVDGGEVQVTVGAWQRRQCALFDFRLRLQGIESRDHLVTLGVGENGVVLSDEDLRAILGLEKEESAERPGLSAEQMAKVVAAATAGIEGLRHRAEGDLARDLSSRRLAEETQLNQYFAQMRHDISGLLDVTQAPEEKRGLSDQLEAVDKQRQQRLDEVRERYSTSSEVLLVGALLISYPHLDGELVLLSGDRQRREPIGLPVFAKAVPGLPCQKTGKPIWHFAATADGRFVDVQCVAVCQESGRVMPRDELATCSVSGGLFCPEYVAECPISRALVQRKIMVTCAECEQSVSPQALDGKRCRACAGRTGVPKTDQRIGSIITAHPKLDSWARWSIAETRDIYTVELTGAFSVARFALRKGDLAPLCAARRTRLLGAWRTVPFSELAGQP